MLIFDSCYIRQLFVAEFILEHPMRFGRQTGFDIHTKQNENYVLDVKCFR